MQLAKLQPPDGRMAFGMIDGDQIVEAARTDRFRTLFDVLDSPDPAGTLTALCGPAASRWALADVQLLAPIDQQEVWAAGVTYKRSRAARMEESQGAASFYDKVYTAARPELFFKATPHRVSGPDRSLRIRRDATWNVPEPELALVLNSRLALVGFTVGNDMSSRDIEGENPLYLPQAKVYNACCGLGPWITLAGAMPPLESVGIHVAVRRGAGLAFEGRTTLANLARTPADLIGWLGRDNSFPNGAFLLTGTGIVPGDDFTLQPGDVVDIKIDGIGTLSNPIVQG